MRCATFNMHWILHRQPHLGEKLCNAFQNVWPRSAGHQFATFLQQTRTQNFWRNSLMSLEEATMSACIEEDEENCTWLESHFVDQSRTNRDNFDNLACKVNSVANWKKKLSRGKSMSWNRKVRLWFVSVHLYCPKVYFLSFFHSFFSELSPFVAKKHWWRIANWFIRSNSAFSLALSNPDSSEHKGSSSNKNKIHQNRRSTESVAAFCFGTARNNTGEWKTSVTRPLILVSSVFLPCCKKKKTAFFFCREIQLKTKCIRL